MEKRQLVPVAELLQIQYGGSTIYTASGTVKPYVEDEDEDENENEVVDEEEIEDSLREDGKDIQVVKLSKIVEFDIHHVSSRKKKLDRYALSSYSIALLTGI
jgi:DNA (cytosine-5)-methyltransferase 1